MSETTTFLDALVEAVRRAGRYNSAELSPPLAILWPDGEREWEPLVPLLCDRLPLLTLGEYEPDSRTGPSYWVRCMLAGTLDDKLPDEGVPVVYMPGVTKKDIRAIEDCRVDLQPIASMQYEGALFTQLNGKDWTVRAFIESRDVGGLGIGIGADSQTRKAAQRALTKLTSVPLERIRAEAPLRAAFFDALLRPDDACNVLAWLNDQDAYFTSCSPDEWEAFCSVCKNKYHFDPESDGPLKAGQQLGERMMPEWELVWTRFAEAPASYPDLPDLLRRAPKKDADMFSRPDAWPQDNEEAETDLRTSLLEAGDMMPADARSRLAELNRTETHGRRRGWVWAKLGLSPLAVALAPLARAAELSEKALTASDASGLGEAYADWGWQVDWAILEALSLVEQKDDVNAVEVIVRAVYRPWLEAAAKQFQSLVGDGNDTLYGAETLADQPAGTCLLFVDGLRMDVARQLASRLIGDGFQADIDWRFAALPTVTATAKPVVTPVSSELRGGGELSPVTDAGTAANITVLRRLMKDAGYQVLNESDLLGDPNGRAWSEAGKVDETGHAKGSDLAWHIDYELRGIAQRVAGLLGEGWAQVVVVTDHGFLLMPGGLPKVELPEHLTLVRKGRCARLKADSETDYQTVLWYWDDSVRFAMAPGIACFEAGKSYEHGGLSPQECVTPVVTVTKVGAVTAQDVEVSSIGWAGLRCKVTVKGAPDGAEIDLRSEPAGSNTTIVAGGKRLDDGGEASLLVEDDSLLGEPVYLVVLGPDDSLLLQSEIKVGETD